MMKPIPGFPGYSVTEDGRVWSERRGGKFLKPAPDSNGYPMVCLYLNGKRCSRKVSTVVAMTFIGPRPEGQEVQHLDGDKSHNDAGNLRYGARRDRK